jgi:LmbE family N-acetylglucosaminyl deacetylase
MRALVIAPHPDDEVLGVGGTMARFSREGHEVFVAIVTRGDASMFDQDFIEQGRGEARQAHQQLGVKETIFMDGFPAALLDTVPQAKLNAALGKLVDDLRPDLLFIPFNGDIHADHRIVFESALVAVRPRGKESVRAVYAYETLSETNWNAPLLTPGFMPNTYFDISPFLEVKLSAVGKFKSQLKPFPNERSIEAVEALATLRGATVGHAAAEAFILVRAIHSLE